VKQGLICLQQHITIITILQLISIDVNWFQLISLDFNGSSTQRPLAKTKISGETSQKVRHQMLQALYHSECSTSVAMHHNITLN
jgi:hypothetical protein